MIPESQQDRDNEREMNKADKETEEAAGFAKCSVCGVMYAIEDGRSTKCRSCYQQEMHHNEYEYHKMRRGFGDY